MLKCTIWNIFPAFCWSGVPTYNEAFPPPCIPLVPMQTFHRYHSELLILTIKTLHLSQYHVVEVSTPNWHGRGGSTAGINGVRPRCDAWTPLRKQRKFLFGTAPRSSVRCAVLQSSTVKCTLLGLKCIPFRFVVRCLVYYFNGCLDSGKFWPSTPQAWPVLVWVELALFGLRVDVT